MRDKFEQIIDEIKRGENLDLYLIIGVSLVLAILGALQVVSFEIVGSAILAVLALLSSALLSNRRAVSELRDSSRSLVETVDGLATTIKAKNSVSDVFVNGYPDFTDIFRSAKRINILGMVLSSTVTRYNQEFVQALKRGVELRFVIGRPTPEVLEMQAFRSSLIKDKEFMASNNQLSLMTLETIRRSAENSSLMQVRDIPYVPPYSLVVVEGKDGLSKAIVRIQSFRTPATEQPTFVVESHIDSKWFAFFADQFEQI